MKLDNRSSHRLSTLRPLVAFALDRAGDLAHLARIEFRDADPGAACHGVAYWMDPEGGTGPHPSAVQVSLSQRAAAQTYYPLFSQHVPELKPVWLSSWTEEALLVIAHELRHVVQFWTDGAARDAHAMEVDAESFAIETLNAWRSVSAAHLKRAS